MKVEIELTEEEVQRLKWFAELPKWIQQEWNEKYGECNCDKLPCDILGRILNGRQVLS